MLPQDFVSQIEKQHPFQYQRLIEAIIEAQPTVSIRLNAKKANFQDFTFNEKVAWCKNGIYLSERPVFSKDVRWHSGAYYVQEASSMFLDYVLHQLFDEKERSNKKVLDLCAAPGGKSTLLLDFFDESSLLVSNEVIPNRLAILRENLGRYGAKNYITTNLQAQHFAQKTEGFFDLIVVDAPCSGEGLFRKDHQAMQEWSLDMVNVCEMRQKDILSNAVEALDENGILIYTTCTFNLQENDENVKFIEERLGLEKIVIANENLENTGIIAVNGIFRFFPGLVKGEGFFLSVFRKKNHTGKQFSKLGSKPFKKVKPPHHWFDKIVDLEFYESDNRFFFLHKNCSEFAEEIASKLQLKFFGIPLGELKGKDFVPSQEAVMAGVFEEIIPSYELTESEALSFLRKENFDLKSTEKGWQILKFQNLPIGFIKNIGNGRFNNYLPKYWRLRLTD